MNSNDLRAALLSGVPGMQTFIHSAEQKLSVEGRKNLIEFLEEISFSSIKYEILNTDKDQLVKVLLVGLLFGQIDPYVAQDKVMMNSYRIEFNELCSLLNVSSTFVVAICTKVDKICSFFN